ncbi:GumC family protein [Roseicella aquatilis]|uniref:Polysaccharide biosynthesis tyrosine autokinase n=1 Tax=Roseicella aquatilis TaxID=2527868 RepID=A0A4R4DD49_9PROT|nr:polysaccharide biosynthesis tyrosine autokinase [Roseicella aquatilis]TCZ57277.1 polysaccharide biosynthesis tyrosine autokinase [Roseicella aquatilis]
MNFQDASAIPPTIEIRPASALNASALLQRLARRWPLVLLVTLASFVLAASVILTLTPRYYAEALLMLEERQARVVSFEQVLSQMPANSEAVQSEAHVLRSRNLMQETAEKLDLFSVPEFNRTLAEPTWLDIARAWTRDIVAKVVPPPPSLPLTEEDIRAGVVSSLQERLSVEPVPRTRAVRISVLSEDPLLAARIVNTHARLYIESQLEAKLTASHNARAFLEAQAAELREKVRQNEEALDTYRSRQGLLQDAVATGNTDTGGSPLARRMLADASTQLAEARRRREEADARVDRLRDPQRRSSLPEVVNNVTVGRLHEQEAMLRQEVMRASRNYGPQHPQVLQLNSALSDLQGKISRETGNIAESLRAEALVRRQNEEAAKTQFERLRSEVERTNAAGVRMAALARESEAGRALLQTILNRLQEVRAGEALQQPDAKIISQAATPTRPAFPKTSLFLLASAIGSVGLGLTAGLIPGRRSKGLSRIADVLPLLEARPLGLVPAVRRPTRASRDLIENPESAFAESIRSILTNLVLDGDLPTSVLVASALPGEGKTSVSVSLARLAAQMGYRALLVDSDLRRPSLHEVLQGQEGPGLCDYLEGRADLASIIQREPSSGLAFVSCGNRTDDPARLLKPAKIMPLLMEWQQSFDLVIFDSSPLVPVSDARLLAHACNQVVFVTQWNRTDLSLVQAELAGLRNLGARIAGVVLTKVDVRRYSRDTFGHSKLLDSYYGRRR